MIKNDAKVEKQRTVELPVDKEALKAINLIVVAFSKIEREFFPTEGAYKAELEVEERAAQVEQKVKDLGFNVKSLPADQYFLTNILVDKPDLVINLVDTVKGLDRLQTSVPAILEFANIRFTGSGMTGLLLGNNRHLLKQFLMSQQIPTPKFKFIKDLRSNTSPDFDPPYIVKLNEGGGSVGIDNNAVKTTPEQVKKKVEEMITDYKMPVLIEQFVGGPEVTAVVYDDGTSKNTFLARKKFNVKPDGKNNFTSLESYDNKNAYSYELLEQELADKITPLVNKTFEALRYNDYAKFDIRLDEADNTPYFIDCNPNTAFGPDKGLPMTEVLGMYGVKFEDVLLSLISKNARAIVRNKEIQKD